VAHKDDLLDLISTPGDAKQSPSVSNVVSGVDTIVGSCRYLDTIRESTHGSTYLVEDNKTKRLIVIKRFNRDSIGLKEARALEKMDHANLVNIIGAGGDSKKTVIVMEYAPGGSLADRLVRTYNWQEAFSIGQQIAAGLSYTHKKEIFHGNLRPSNVLFDADETIKLSDFGSPLHYSSRKNWYSPPEKGVSARGDIYSLGVILHQMLFGKTPEYSRHGRLQIEEIGADLPGGAIEILRRLLALQCAERYQSCDEVLADWKDLQEGKSPATKAKPAAQIGAKSRLKQKKTDRGVVMLAIGLFVGMALGIAISYAVGFYG
jgi:serine/threonine protein kinase